MTGRSRGFGFVEMANDDEAQAAIEGLNRTDLGGRTITVNVARPKTDRPRGGGQMTISRGVPSVGQVGLNSRETRS